MTQATRKKNSESVVILRLLSDILLTKLTQSIFSVSYDDPVGIFLFAREVVERLHGRLAVPLQYPEWLLTMTPGIGSRSVKQPQKRFYTNIIPPGEIMAW